MIGAIIGDIVGSNYEFRPVDEYDFDLFPTGADYTDDSLMTIAVAKALLEYLDLDEDEKSVLK
jgi:ADP-ribosyl-[dinitrogen reductase] hydrolase